MDISGHPKLITPFLILTDFEPRNYVCVCVCVYNLLLISLVLIF